MFILFKLYKMVDTFIIFWKFVEIFKCWQASTKLLYSGGVWLTLKPFLLIKFIPSSVKGTELLKSNATLMSKPGYRWVTLVSITSFTF